MDELISQTIFETCKIAYAVADQALNVLETGGATPTFFDTEQDSAPCSLFDLIPELAGSESVLDDVLAGELDSFYLENINRPMSNGSLQYLNLVILPYQSNNPRTALLAIFSDTSEQSQTAQMLMQRHNELCMLQRDMHKADRRPYRHSQPRAEQEPKIDVHIAEKIIQEYRISYAIADKDMAIVQVNGACTILDADSLGHSLLSRIPELIGSETVLADILSGQLARFQLERVNRPALNGVVSYLTITILPYQDKAAEPALLIVVTDTSEQGQFVQLLAQQRNELRLLQRALVEANDQLESRVRERTIELTQANARLNQEIAERIWAQKALQDAHDELEKRVEERTAELAQANQELRTEIAERLRIEHALRESEERYRSVTLSANDAIISADSACRILSWNHGAQVMFNYPEAAMLGQPLSLVIPDLWQCKSLPGATGNLPLIGNIVELEGLRQDGSRFPVELGLSSWELDGQAFYSAIIRNITDRKQAEEMLHKYTAELETQNAELEAFVHTVAHDIKSPLTGLIGYSEVLEQELDILSKEDLRHDFQYIAQSGYKICNIVDELLLLASVRAENIMIYPLKMADILVGIKTRLALMIQEHQAEITWLSTWPIVLGYGPWVEEVWINYISNAIKYGGNPPHIELGFDTIEQKDEKDRAYIRFWVRDNGPGLTQEQQIRLFTPFERLHQAHVQGYGLGLSIVHRIIEKLGGQVGVESQFGQGSTFYFTLPAVEQARI